MSNNVRMDSIIEQNDLTEFLSYATLANKEFAASHDESLTLIVNDSPQVFTIRSQSNQLEGETKENAKRRREQIETVTLEIPRRPNWTVGMTAEELHEKEKQSFLNWRRKLSAFEQETDATLTPYEKNLHMWRQLWRVIERSDVVVQIVDCRNPLMFRSKDLESYVHETDPDKMNILLINKSDMLTEKQRFKWAKYFRENGLKTIFFSAYQEQNKINSTTHSKEELLKIQQDMLDKFDINAYIDPGEQDWTHIYTREELLCYFKSLIKALVPKLREKQRKRAELLRLAKLKQKEEAEAKKKKNRRRYQNAENNEEEKASEGIKTNINEEEEEEEEIDDPNNKVVVGMVGYPNVGKSSVINTLCGLKKVAVGATPGKTKHFQTLPIGKYIMLCDCPGLVFPSMRTTKEDMICDGILSIDQMRDYRAPIHLVCQRIPRRVFELLYGIDFDSYKNKKITEVQKTLRLKHSHYQNKPLTVDELLTAFAISRGLMAQKGVPNFPAAARVILKDYVAGKILYCHAPPNDKINFNEGNAFDEDMEQVEEIHLENEDEELSDDEEYFTESDSEQDPNDLDELIDSDGEIVEDIETVLRNKANMEFNRENIHSSLLDEREQKLKDKRRKNLKKKRTKPTLNAEQEQLENGEQDDELTEEQIEFLSQATQELDTEVITTAVPTKIKFEELTPKQRKRKMLLLKKKK